MKINALLEEQSRADLLKWQERFIDCFPDQFDIGLDIRELPQGRRNVITVARNGKELFFVDTSRADAGFISTMTVNGEHITPYHIGVSSYESEFKTLLYIYDIARKLRNLNTGTSVLIGRKNFEIFTITVALKAYGGFSDYLSIEYKPAISMFNVKIKSAFSIKQLATTKDDSKIVDLIDKLFKEHVKR